MNVKSYNTKDYENIANWTLGENKPKQSQLKPISMHNKPKQSQFQCTTNPNKANFRTLFPLTARPVRRKTLSSNGAGNYNGIFSLMSCFQRTPIERDSKWIRTI
ncbi:MAG TPA: hypothetical protein VMW72_23365 [Sedimentisphaerales bacterium]|nr:hypothetical protein [Sedimentisphaerales bacterium]